MDPSVSFNFIMKNTTNISNKSDISTPLDQHIQQNNKFFREIDGVGVEMYYFKGRTPRKALIIGGAHGAEQAGIQVVQMLIQKLRKSWPYFTVILVPVQFPEQDKFARTKRPKRQNKSYQSAEDPKWLHGEGKRITRSVSPRLGGEKINTNRNMPDVGSGPDKNNPVDSAKRPILIENQIVIDLINRFKPERICNVHATSNSDRAGVFANTRYSDNGEFEAENSAWDQDLAITMSKRVAPKTASGNQNPQLANKRVAGNHIGTPKQTGMYKNEKYNREKFNNTDGKTSVGEWGAHGIPQKNYDGSLNPYGRPSSTVITVEIRHYHRAPENPSSDEGKTRLEELESHVDAIREVFLDPPNRIPIQRFKDEDDKDKTRTPRPNTH